MENALLYFLSNVFAYKGKIHRTAGFSGNALKLEPSINNFLSFQIIPLELPIGYQFYKVPHTQTHNCIYLCIVYYFTLQIISRTSLAVSPGWMTVKADWLFGRQYHDGVKYSWTQMSESGLWGWTVVRATSFSLWKKEWKNFWLNVTQLFQLRTSLLR